MKLLILFFLISFFGEARASHYNISEVDIIPKEYRDRLVRFGIYNSEILLYIGKTKFSRWRLANIIRVRTTELFKWIQFSDLLRVKGIGPNVARLLYASNVRDIKELRQQEANKLLGLIVATNNQKGVTKVIPEVNNLLNWINQARRLRTILQY